MRKTMKRFLSVCLSVAMVSLIFAGCATKDKKPNDSDQIRKDLDFGGETIKIVVPPGYGLVDDSGKDSAIVERDKKLEEMGKKYNAKFEVKEGRGNYWDVMASSIANGSPAGHIMMTQENFFLDWLKAGAFADLTEAMKKTGIDFKDSRYNQTVRKYSNINDKQYCFSKAPLNPSGMLWFYNKRILSEANLPDPQDLYEKGEWNWDAVENIAKKALKKKTDGTVEQWGLSAYMHMDMLSALCISNGTSIASFDKDGKPSLTLNDPKAMKAFEKMYDWVVTQKIAKVNDGSQNWDTALREFTTGNIALMMGTNKLLEFIEESAMEDDFGLVAPPIGPDVDKHYTAAGCGEMYFIPKTYENMADKLILVIDELYDFGKESYEDKITEKYINRVRDEKSMQHYIKMTTDTENQIYDAFVMTRIDWVSEPSIHSLMSVVLKGERTPGDALEANKLQFQKCMEDTMGDLKVTGK